MSKAYPVAILAAIAAGIYLLMNRKPRSTHITTTTRGGDELISVQRRNKLMEDARNGVGRPEVTPGQELSLAQEEQVVNWLFAAEGVEWGPVKVLTPNSVFDDLAYENILRGIEEALGLFPSTITPRPLETALILMVENRDLLIAKTGVIEAVLKEQGRA